MASDLMNVGATGRYYKVQPNGKAETGLSVGDRVVTNGGTYQILKVNSDGSYQSALYDENITTKNYTGKYANDYGPYSGAQSISNDTKKDLSDAYDYDYSSSVSRDKYDEVLSQRPGSYESSYRREMEDILDKLENREDFSYSLNDDILYRQYRDSYMNAGKLAMEDASGQAASLTGGYGNTYAQSVSSAAYERYLQQLSDRIPELYQLSRDAYDAEGDELYRLYSLYSAADSADYERYRDSVSDWENDRNYYYSEYMNELANARDDYYDRLSVLQDAADMESSDYWKNKDQQNFEEQMQFDREQFEDEMQFDREQFEYEKAYNAAKLASSAAKSSSSSKGKTVTVSIYDNAVEAYEDGGEAELNMYAEKLRGSGYSSDGINDVLAYARKYGKSSSSLSSLFGLTSGKSGSSSILGGFLSGR